MNLQKNFKLIGSEELRAEMACYLGEIALGPDNQTYVAEKSSLALMNMVQSGNSISRSAAFKALKQISSYQLNSKLLAEAGIVQVRPSNILKLNSFLNPSKLKVIVLYMAQVMIEEMFARNIQSEPVDSKNEAAAILANILESGLEFQSLQGNAHGQTISSDYIIYNIIYWIKNSTPDDLNMNLIRILLCLMKFPKASAIIVSVIKETEASYNLIELINDPNEEIGVASIKLLTTLSTFMGHTLADRLCKNSGQPESLIKNPTEIPRITEKHAVSANFLAKLPHQNLSLNLALINRNMVPKIIDNVNWIQRTGTRTSRYANAYFEGLVGILVRFTTTLYDFQVLSLVRDYNFTALFTEILMKTSSDDVQKSSAIGLENLSNQSASLSKPQQKNKIKNKKVSIFEKCFLKSSTREERESLCPIHRGNCSSQITFCLVEANAIERLLTCLEHENVEVVKAALSAICTLLDDKVDVDKSVKVLNEMNAIKHVLNVVKDHREEALLQKTLWVIDKFISGGGDESISDISEDRLFPSTLISAFHHGNESTRQMAEKILRHLNKIPTFSINNLTL